MNKKKVSRDFLKARRKSRVRRKISGDTERPRLSFFKSARHVYAQVIDDTKGVTLVSVSSMSKENRTETNANIKVCESLGSQMAAKCKEKNIKAIRFDKNGNKFHGRVKAFAEAAREAGLIF